MTRYEAGRRSWPPSATYPRRDARGRPVAGSARRESTGIVAAAMQDVDGDARADRLRLVYSETVRHANDRDGRFPFSVAGYRFRSVGRASGKAILVQLVERGTAGTSHDLSCGTAGRPSSECSTGAGTRRCVSCSVARGRTGRARLRSRNHSANLSPSTTWPQNRR